MAYIYINIRMNGRYHQQVPANQVEKLISSMWEEVTIYDKRTQYSFIVHLMLPDNDDKMELQIERR